MAAPGRRLEDVIRIEGQFDSWIEAVGGGTEARFIGRLFGLCA